MKLFNRSLNDESRGEMSFIEHLDVLRGHLFKSALAVAVGAIIVAIYNKFIFQRILLGPAKPDFPTYGLLCSVSRHLGLGTKLCLSLKEVKLQSNTVTGQFGVYFNSILIGGFILAFPYVFWQFWRFSKPALTTKELKNTRGVIFWVSLLFFTGVSFGYFIIAPYTISFFSRFSLDSTIGNLWTVASYFDLIVPLILGAGLAFQLPLVIYFLAKVGVVSAKYLRSIRKYAIITMLILAGIITPPDMLSQIVCTVPLMMLYEIGVLLCVKVEKKQKQEDAAQWS
jgi:sec-independent protein translocase protein TatC